ncbi:MAG: hypothetical protein GXY89_08565 [Tissierellia bacterium]|jgi:hypothetical protein|nr:hypothetical protein [Tissierellia bacterium]
MRETLKTLAIIFLSISSVVLIILNFGVKPENIFIEKNEPSGSLIFDSSVIMADAVMPEYIGVNFEGGKHTVINNPRDSGVWADSIEILKSIFEEKGKIIQSRETITVELYKNFLNQESVVLFFNKDITPLTLLNSLGVEEPKDVVDEYEEISFIYLSLTKNFIVIGEKDELNLLTLDQLEGEKLKRKIDNLFISGYNPYVLGEEILGFENLNYFPKISQHKVEIVRFENILTSLNPQNIENIVYSFFGKEVNYIREIKEEGSQTIYVDGSRLLKISEKGLISYYDPEQEPSKDRNLYISLENALAFISNNLGYDGSLYLKEILPIEIQENQGFKITFGKNSKGYKVELLDDDIVDYIEIDVFNEHIRRYSQFFRGEVPGTVEYYDIDQTQELRPIVAVNLNYINGRMFENSAEYLNYEEVLKKIKRAYVVYTDLGEDENLGVAWKVEIEDEIFYFEIQTN